MDITVYGHEEKVWVSTSRLTRIVRNRLAGIQRVPCFHGAFPTKTTVESLSIRVCQETVNPKPQPLTSNPSILSQRLL